MNAKRGVTSLVHGIAAGAAGTAVLNAATYADMAVRVRPPSELPEKMVKEIARRAGASPPEGPRGTAFGALLGYADGFSVGAMYGLARPAMPGIPWVLAGLGLAALTFALSEGMATAMGQTDPREWSAADWTVDLVSRCLYGWVTALTFEALERAPDGRPGR